MKIAQCTEEKSSENLMGEKNERRLSETEM